MAEPQEPERIERRIMSGRGLVRWTPDRIYRRFWFNCQVIRLPTQDFVSKKINPDRSEYAQITFCRGNSVLREERMNFRFQTFVWEQDMTGYLANSTQCWFEAISEQIATVQLALGIPVLPGDEIIANPIFDQFDRVRFVIRPDAALLVDFWGLKYDENCGYGEEGSPPPPPPPNEPPVPPGSPVDVSPPYEEPDDNDDTIPLPDDGEAPPPPVGEACTYYNVVLAITQVDGMVIFPEFQLFGEFDGAGIDETGNRAFITCRGGISSIEPPAGECLPSLTDCIVYQNLGFDEPTLSAATILSFTPIEP